MPQKNCCQEIQKEKKKDTWLKEGGWDTWKKKPKIKQRDKNDANQTRWSYEGN